MSDEPKKMPIIIITAKDEYAMAQRIVAEYPEYELIGPVQACCHMENRGGVIENVYQYTATLKRIEDFAYSFPGNG